MNIVHVTSFHDHPDSIRRNQFARSTWRDAYRDGTWRPLPLLDESLPRLFKEGKRQLPYIKDMINEACKLETEYICLSNADTCFAPLLCLSIHKCHMIYCHRKDFPSLTRKLSQTEVSNCPSRYCGLDLFLFPRKWWLLARASFPDVLLGRETWDLVLQKTMEAHGGVYVDNMIYHESHDSVWQNPANRTSLPGQLHNRKLAYMFCEARGLDCTDFGFRPYLKPVRPTISQTPAGGWKCTWCGITKTSHSIELLTTQMKFALKEIEIEAPRNLRDIIITQSLPEESWV